MGRLQELRTIGNSMDTVTLQEKLSQSSLLLKKVHSLLALVQKLCEALKLRLQTRNEILSRFLVFDPNSTMHSFDAAQRQEFGASYAVN
uniref:Uncharacterized protein n=1 Tax=Romanomermis culicivorax TaxID=13658 RepID=A0A915HIU3_ROMCU